MMTKTRLEAFSDGVLAIVITIMVLELRTPADAGWSGLRELLPEFGMYVLSFAFVGIYWSNHHHLIHAAVRVNSRVLLRNLHLLFWLSLLPFVTGWVGHSHFAPVPTALYGLNFLAAAIGWHFLQSEILRQHGPDSKLAETFGRDRKGKASLVGYAAAVPLAFVNPWISMAIYAAVAVWWLIPDRRIEAGLQEHQVI
jgi:uncharacterized membrane protein